MSSGKRLALLLLCLSTVACDRVTKVAASAVLAGGEDRLYLGDLVRLTYAENTGAFLSLGAEWPPVLRLVVFIGFSGIALVYLASIWWRHASPPWQKTGIALFVVGGALNWWDRVTQGYVVDFLVVGSGRLSTGVFNVADVALLGGAIVFVGTEAWKRGRRNETRDTPDLRNT